jgi:hypothetical protein
MIRKNAALIVTVLIFSMVLIGQALTYYAVPYKYDAAALITDDGVDYEVSSNSSVSYRILAYDDARPVGKLYIYYDENYAVHGTTHKEQRAIISSMIAELKIRGVTDTELVNAAELYEKISIYKDGDAALIMSGALPVNVYDGDTNLKIFDWVNAGGSLYWMGDAIGAKYADGKTLTDAPADHQQKIFGVAAGVDCILTEYQPLVKWSGNELSEALALTYAGVVYGMNVTALGALSLGFEYVSGSGDVYGSVSMVESGDGMICVVGRFDSSSALTSMAQLIATGVSPSSELIGSASGSFIRGGSATGTLSWDASKTDVAVQIRMGEPFTVYARTF